MLKTISKWILPTIIIIFAIFAGFVNHKDTLLINDNHFTLLAGSFIKNDLFLSPDNLPPGDYVDYRGKQYLFYGPLPSILLTPFVFIFGEDFPQFALSIASVIITYYLAFKLCRKFKFSQVNSLWLANFFVFGTVLYFVSLVNISAYLVQVLAMALILLALLEYFNKRRWLVIGILVSLAAMSRLTLYGYLIFFLLEIFRQRKTINLTRVVIFLLAPVIISSIVLGMYNFRRFGSILDTGYSKNITAIHNESNNSNVGFISVKHIPANLYALAIMTPEPIKDDRYDLVLKFPYLKANGFGMSILFTSPLLIYLLITRRKDYSRSAVLGTVALLIPSLLYFGIGTSQFGYRYSLDFLPLLFILLIPAFGKVLPRFARTLIICGILFNSLYMLSLWNAYPVFEFFGLTVN